MKSYHTLAWKELWAQKVTSVLILIAIVLSTMMTTVIGQSIGILSAMQQSQAINLNGNRYATLHQMTEEQASKLLADSRLSYTGSYISIGRADIKNSKISVLLREYIGNALSAYPSDSQLESGKLPEKAEEIALPQNVLDMLDFQGEIGDTISLNLSISLLRDIEAGYEYTHNFILTGILKSNYVGYVSGTVMGIVGTGTAEKVLPDKYMLYSVDIRTAQKKSFQSTINDLASQYDIPEYCIQYNDTMLSAVGIEYESGATAETGSGFSYMTLAGVLIGALVLLAAGLVVYNILKIAVIKRVKEYGVLRAIGAEKGKLYLLVSLQLAILCGIGIPIGILLGLLSAQGVTTAVSGFFNPEIFLVSSEAELAAMIAQNAGSKILPLLVSVGITIIFALVSAMPAAGYAAKVSPTTAMLGQTTTVKRRNRKTKHIRNFEAFYARMNMKRNRGRTAVTILSLIMSITVFVALQSFSGLLDVSEDVQKMHLGDYSMTSQTIGFSPEELAELKNVSGIQAVSTLKYSLYQQDENGELNDIETSITPQPGETMQMIGIDDVRLKGLVPTLSESDLQALTDGTACFIQNPISIFSGGTEAKNTVLSVGDTVVVNDTSLRVLGLLDAPITLENEGFINGIQVVVSDTVYDKITQRTGYTELYPTLTQDADRSFVEQAVQALCSKNGGTWLSYANTDQQLKESYEQIRLLAWGLILFVGLIGILNIINTVYTNIHTRVTEIGVQRAIGMSARSLYKTFLWEGAYYGIIASLIGAVAGYICTIFVGSAGTDTLQLVSIPFLSIAEAAGISILACLIATYLPLKKIAKMNIVESIETVE
ncbi:ABC transporter permease [Anaerocolumna cellulosilytica]|uniref:ABC transporter permease n=1 Tax=Anaerocolumna cellulosilytica TaxID=433286 RepID=A0A6S6R595_9FIRM|nr:FtsX-like permease family protein [Anaerocolumna cellulosilytica]MBB5197494.1 ABC-type antimicrobial peptide transport system permease subunit [Anaerocolumna cellulosilytica]BCJ96519.1 ABC transporter permease [Anaerocolumna cellulosilytica]